MVAGLVLNGEFNTDYKTATAFLNNQDDDLTRFF